MLAADSYTYQCAKTEGRCLEKARAAGPGRGTGGRRAPLPLLGASSFSWRLEGPSGLHPPLESAQISGALKAGIIFWGIPCLLLGFWRMAPLI